MSTPRSPRLPLGPLLSIVGQSTNALAVATGVDEGQLCRDHRAGGVTPSMADRLAVALGRTPGELWGHAWWDLPDGACGPTEHVTAEQRIELDRRKWRDRASKQRNKRRQPQTDNSTEEISA
jgi:hypothetical protein